MPLKMFGICRSLLGHRTYCCVNLDHARASVFLNQSQFRARTPLDVKETGQETAEAVNAPSKPHWGATRSPMDLTAFSNHC